LSYRTIMLALVVLALVVSGCTGAPAPTAAPVAPAPPAATQAPAGTATPAAAAGAQPTARATAAALPTMAPPAADGSRPLANIAPDQRADRFGGPAPMSIDVNNVYVATIKTSKGDIVAELFSDTPQSANNFIVLAENGFYDGLTFHRVEPDFVIQGGDPSGDGSGGPGYTIPAEIKHPHNRGALAWARTSDQVNPQRRSSGSQFYITLEETSFLDNAYTVFGQVIDGMDVVDSIEVGDTIEQVTIDTAQASRMPTPRPTPMPTVTPVPVAPNPEGGRPLAQVPPEERANLYNTPPAMTIDVNKKYQARVVSSQGEFVLDLRAAEAPESVNNFVVLANLGYYDGMHIAHVEPDVYAVFGSPERRPDSDVGYLLTVPQDADAGVETGSVAYYPAPMAEGPEPMSSGSQFFIALAPVPDTGIPLNIFATVASGLEIVNSLTSDDTITSITIVEQ
jgi:cyclophilin family peptidyl-prolyl cis-trans isomerase